MPGFIPDYWTCLDYPERVVTILCATPILIPPGYVLASSIDAVFAAQTQIDPDTRREAWEANYNMERTTITLDDVEVEVYILNQQWCADVANARLEGKCQVNDPLCSIIDFYNSPISYS